MERAEVTQRPVDSHLGSVKSIYGLWSVMVALGREFLVIHNGSCRAKRVRVWNNVHHIQISVQHTPFGRVGHPKIILEDLRKALQETRTNEVIQLSKSIEEKRVLIFAGGGGCTQVSTDIEVRDPPKQHDGFD